MLALTRGKLPQTISRTSTLGVCQAPSWPRRSLTCRLLLLHCGFMMPGLFQSLKVALQKSNHRHGVGPPPGTRSLGKKRPWRGYNKDSKPSYKTWRLCAHKDCKNQSEAYAKGRNYGFLASPYCSDHACRHWDYGQPCKNSTKKDEPLCDIRKQSHLHEIMPFNKL